MRLDDRPVIDQITEPSIDNIIEDALARLSDKNPQHPDAYEAAMWAGDLIADYIIERLAQ